MYMMMYGMGIMLHWNKDSGKENVKEIDGVV